MNLPETTTTTIRYKFRGKMGLKKISGCDKIAFIDLYLSGASLSEISRKFNFDIGSISAHLHLLDLRIPQKLTYIKFSDEQRKEICRQYLAGHSIWKITNAFSPRVSYPRILSILKESGIEKRSQKNCPTKTERTFEPKFTPLPLPDLPKCKLSGIYKFTNLVNGKAYIGQSINIQRRYYSHSEMKHKGLFTNALKKYGIGNFNFEILERVDDFSELDSREQYWMDFYQTYDKAKGYNIATIAGLSTRRGSKCTPEQVAIIKENLRKRYIDKPNPMKGRPFLKTPETLEKIIRKNKERTKKVAQINNNTDEVLRVWESAMQASSVLQIKERPIRNACLGFYRIRGKTYLKNTYAGYKWEYVEE